MEIIVLSDIPDDGAMEEEELEDSEKGMFLFLCKQVFSWCLLLP
jgi:hypothetical protein